MLSIVIESMQSGEVAAMYQQGVDTIIMVAEHITPQERIDAINRMLALVRQPGVLSVAV